MNRSRHSVPPALVITASLTAALVLAGCAGGASASDGPSTQTSGTSGTSSKSCPSGIAIGVLAGLTGPVAGKAANIRNGVQLAVDEHNAAAGACQVTLRSFDSTGDPDQAAVQAQQAVADGTVVGLVGPQNSSEALKTGPVLDKAGLVGISASATNPTLTTKGWRTFFRVVSNDSVGGPVAASYLTKTLGKQKVFVIDDGGTYGKGLADIVRATLGTALAGSGAVTEGQTDFSDVIADVKAAGADAVYYGGYYAEAAGLLTQLRAAGLDSGTLTFVSDDGAKDNILISNAGAAAEGAYITCPCAAPEDTSGTFAADYTKSFNAPPGTFSAEAFDAASILLHGIDAGNTDRAKLLAYTASQTEQGVTKPLKFSSTGEMSSPVVWVYQVEGGQFVSKTAIAGGRTN